MNPSKPFQLLLQFVLSLLLLAVCLHEVVYNENVIQSELCKAVAVFANIGMLAAVSGNSIEKKDDTYENNKID